MPNIFISYRKVDTPWTPDLVYLYLKGRFGADQVFKSGQSIPAGADFSDALVIQAATSDIMLVLIGPGWLTAPAADGTRKIDAADDWVRREIATAIHNRRHVVPLLLGDEVMLPGPDELPADIAQLGRSQFVRLYRSSADFGLDKVAARLLELVPGLSPDPEPAPVSPVPDARPAPAGPGTVDVRGGEGTATTIVGGSGALSAATGKHSIAVTTGEGSRVKIVNRARRFAATHPLLAAVVVVGTLSGTTFGTYQIAEASQNPPAGSTLFQPADHTGSAGTSGQSGSATPSDQAAAAAAGDPTPVPCPAMDQMAQATGFELNTIGRWNSPPSMCSYEHDNESKTPTYVINAWQPPPHLGAAGTWTLAQYHAKIAGPLTPQPALGAGAFSTGQQGTTCAVWFVPQGHQLVVEVEAIEYLGDAETDVCTPALHAAALMAGVLPPQ
ncbi:MAG: toll/interleukin-1 receptor domain-containing protein [Catenulispora sp.]|nr:toll/interleukin-1 receptor domain-containing protein [Catenulispora sp.]